MTLRDNIGVRTHIRDQSQNTVKGSRSYFGGGQVVKQVNQGQPRLLDRLPFLVVTICACAAGLRYLSVTTLAATAFVRPPKLRLFTLSDDVRKTGSVSQKNDCLFFGSLAFTHTCDNNPACGAHSIIGVAQLQGCMHGIWHRGFAL